MKERETESVRKRGRERESKRKKKRMKERERGGEGGCKNEGAKSFPSSVAKKVMQHTQSYTDVGPHLASISCRLAPSAQVCKRERMRERKKLCCA